MNYFSFKDCHVRPCSPRNDVMTLLSTDAVYFFLNLPNNPFFSSRGKVPKCS